MSLLNRNKKQGLVVNIANAWCYCTDQPQPWNPWCDICLRGVESRSSQRIVSYRICCATFLRTLRFGFVITTHSFFQSWVQSSCVEVCCYLSPSASGAPGTFGCRMYPRQTPMPRLFVTCAVLLGCVCCTQSIVTRSTVCMARYTKQNLNRPIADNSLVECIASTYSFNRFLICWSYTFMCTVFTATLT